MVIAVGLIRRKGARAAREVSATTGELLRRNAELLKESTVEIAKEAEKGIVDVETVRKVNTDLITTIEEVIRISARRSRRQTAEQGSAAWSRNSRKNWPPPAVDRARGAASTDVAPPRAGRAAPGRGVRNHAATIQQPTRKMKSRSVLKISWLRSADNRDLSGTGGVPRVPSAQAGARTGHLHFDLLDALARRLRVRRGAGISLAGIKDRHGDTTQHVAIPDRADLPDTVTDGNYELTMAGFSPAPVSPGYCAETVSDHPAGCPAGRRSGNGAGRGVQSGPRRLPELLR